MRKTVFIPQTIQAKPSVISLVADAICHARSSTRKELADVSGLSHTTVSKVVNALLDSGAIVEKRGKSADGASSLHLSLSNKICTAVVDLSTSVYSINLISRGESYLRYVHKYDSGLDFRDNLYELFSRGFSKIRLKEGVAMSICILYADFAEQSRSNQIYLPSEHDKETIDSALYDVCRRTASLYISKSQAISDAIKFNAIDNVSNLGGVSFLFLGTTLSAFSISDAGITRRCEIQRLFIKDALTADEYMRSCFTDDQFELLLERAINFVDSAFGSGALIVESDLFDINADSIKRISRSYAKARLSLPIIHTAYSGGHNTGILIISAAKRTESDFIKSLVTSNE